MTQSNVCHLRRVSPPLAGYFRVGHRDDALVTKLLEQSLPTGAGVIVDPAALSRTADLRSAAVENGVEVILDPKSVELSTVGGMASTTVSGGVGVARLGCRHACCGRDRDAILQDPRRHFLVTRSNEVTQLSTTPDSERAEHYLTTALMPARDNAARLARFLPTLATHRNRLDDWCLALRRTLDDDATTQHTTALVPTGHRLSQSA